MRSNFEDVWNWVADIADYSRETKNKVNYLHDDVLDVLKDIKINTLF
jgi:excinuclease UvrABC helicase subunit UvrB